jgi:hypothetical protein
VFGCGTWNIIEFLAKLELVLFMYKIWEDTQLLQD